MGLLDGKVAVITGAGRGIGRETALAFAREGARLVLNDHGVALDGSKTAEDAVDAGALLEEVAAAGGEAVFDDADVSRPETADALAKLATTRFGALDVWLNNAGILRDRTLQRQEPSDWQAVIDVHLTATYYGTRAAARAMRGAGHGGSIINTTSRSGMLGNFGQSNYAAAKAGIYALTRTAALELLRHEIRVNAVAPLAKTRMTQGLPIFEHVTTMRSEHVAPVHVFLASDLSREVTGHVVSVAGGKLSTYKLVESRGEFKEADEGVWSATEIAESWPAISRA